MVTDELHRILRPLLCACAGAIVFVPAAGSATSSPTNLYTAMIAAGKKQESVHYTSIQNVGTDRVVMSADVAATQGIQRIAYTKNGQTGHVLVAVTGGNAYVLGDAFTLVNYMGYNAAAAAAYSDQWIQIPPTDPDFKAVTANVTLPSSVGELDVPTPLVDSPSMEVNGRVVIGVMGTAPATSSSSSMIVSLYAGPAGRLPFEEYVMQGNSQSTTRFSRWNERIKIGAPVNATPISDTGLE